MREFPRPKKRCLRKSLDAIEVVDIDDYDENDIDLESLEEPDKSLAAAYENMLRISIDDVLKAKCFSKSN